MAQSPIVHCGLACWGAQREPQAPHELTVVFRLVSQPLVTSPSQLPQPPLQVIEHWEFAQPATPLTVEQAWAQAPQCVGSVVVLTSQPSDARPLQSAKPGSQAPTWQTPCAQTGVSLAMGQALPQTLQLATLVLRLVSQPLVTSLSQLPKPGAQAIAQAPARHDGVPLTDEQRAPQLPQLRGSPAMLVSQPSIGL